MIRPRVRSKGQGRSINVWWNPKGIQINFSLKVFKLNFFPYKIIAHTKEVKNGQDYTEEGENQIVMKEFRIGSNVPNDDVISGRKELLSAGDNQVYIHLDTHPENFRVERAL